MMRGGAESVQQPGAGQDKRAGADGEQKLAALSVTRYPLEHDGVLHLSACAEAAGDQQDVWRGGILEGVERRDHESVPGADCLAALRDGEHIERVELRSAAADRKDLEWPGEVEDFYFVEEHDGDGAAIHGECVRAWTGVMRRGRA